MIEHFLEVPDGSLYVANGIDAVVRWDGFKTQFEEVGLDAPSSALTLGGSGIGPIVGEYYGYQRFVDDQGNVSNLSAVSALYTAQGSTGTITGASDESPIVITSAAHGLTSGSTVKIEGVGGNTSANNTWIITVLTADTFSLDDSHTTAEYTGGGTWISGVSTITYSSVPLPLEAKVVRRQLLRNTDGQTTTFYVDVDTTDLSGTSFPSTRTDTDLAAQESVPLLNEDQSPFANRHDKPLDFYPFLVHHLDRLFLMGQIEYNVGHVKVTFGSTSVVGVGTDWKSTMAGRYLYVSSARQSYEIASVNESTQTITLTTAYVQPTDLFAFYSIKSPPAYRRLVAFSEAGLPQSWPAANTLELQETGDEITGGMQKGAFVYVLERRHIHKLTFAISPNTDGAVFMVAQRGCINNRCWVVVDESAYMLDELGIHRFSGNAQVEHLSTGVQNLFRQDDDVSPHKINWRWKEYFHANLDRQRETIRWFVSMDGSRYPQHAICYQYRSQRWWVEKMPFPIGGSCAGEMDRNPQVFYGGQHRKILAAWVGTTDLVDAKAGDVRSDVTGSSAFTLSDSLSVWPTTGLVNTPISITHGTGKGQVRRIISVSGTTLVLDSPWAILPDTTSTYQIGGVHWVYRSAWMRLATSEVQAQRRFEMIFGYVDEPTTADLRFFTNFSETPDQQAVTKASDDGGGIESTEGEADLIIDLTSRPGIVDRQLPSHSERYSQGRDFVQFELEGFSNKELLSFYSFSYEGALPESGIDDNA